MHSRLCGVHVHLTAQRCNVELCPKPLPHGLSQQWAQRSCAPPRELRDLQYLIPTDATLLCGECYVSHGDCISRKEDYTHTHADTHAPRKKHTHTHATRALLHTLYKNSRGGWPRRFNRVSWNRHTHTHTYPHVQHVRTVPVHTASASTPDANTRREVHARSPTTSADSNGISTTSTGPRRPINTPPARS